MIESLVYRNYKARGNNPVINAKKVLLELSTIPR